MSRVIEVVEEGGRDLERSGSKTHSSSSSWLVYQAARSLTRVSQVFGAIRVDENSTNTTCVYCMYLLVSLSTPGT